MANSVFVGLIMGYGGGSIDRSNERDEFCCCVHMECETTYFDRSSPYGNTLEGGTYGVLVFDSKSLRSPALRAVLTVLSNDVTQSFNLDMSIPLTNCRLIYTSYIGSI